MIRRFPFIILLALLLPGLALPLTQAQDNRNDAGDPAVASLIAISEPDAKGLVTITGAAGAVFPAAQVAVRNLYTGDTTYVQATSTGTFSARLYGPGNTPFWISPARNIPNTLRDQPGSLPGGPGTIIYGPLPRNGGEAEGIITNLVVDAALGDWASYAGSGLVADGGVQALLNRQSIYIALERADLPAEYDRMRVQFTLDGSTYRVSLNPAILAPAEVERVSPNPTALAPLPVAVAAAGGIIEMRFPYPGLNVNNPSVEEASLEQISFVDTDGVDLLLIPMAGPMPVLDEGDGLVRDSQIDGSDSRRFSLAGTVAQGAARWSAEGRASDLALEPGETLRLEMDVTLAAPELAEALTGLRLGGRFFLQALALDDGRIAPGGLDTNNGWAAVQTPGGLGIINLRGDVPLGDAFAPWQQIIRQGEDLIFPLDADLVIPADLPAGYYALVFEGFGQVGDGEPFRWDTNNLLATGRSATRPTLARLPLVLDVGEAGDGRLLFSLFQDVSSNGGRGVLAAEDQAGAALAGRVRFEPPTFILPPFDRDGNPIRYPVEPYLPQLLANTFDHTIAPLVPFLFPGGRMTARVIRPDGEVDDLGSAAILQNQLSTDELDERSRFGVGSPVDVYRLTTLNSSFAEYAFPLYGDYEIELRANLQDIWGHSFNGGGTYRVTVAEPLVILPAMLPGTPLEAGNVFTPGLHLLPGVAAEVTVTLRTFPLDGSAGLAQQIRGQANGDGIFMSDGIVIGAPGEYIADYEVRYTDEAGRLWAGSLRSAGVIANPAGALVARGGRGLAQPAGAEAPAWYSAANLLGGNDEVTPRLRYPYFGGDVAWLTVGEAGQITPVIQVQDQGGGYTEWLIANNPALTDLPRLAVEGELPVMDAPGRAYSYISLTGPTVTARQYVQGGLEGGLDTTFRTDEALNQQAGVGINGALPGDYFFLFGGAVVRDDSGDLLDSAIYASLAVVEAETIDSRGPRVFPPYSGEAGGASGGPVMTIRDVPIELFFLPTATRPGDVLTVGDRLVLAGQVGPTLASELAVSITSPSGAVQQFNGQANAIGYYYDPARDFVVTEPGLWTIRLTVQHTGSTSAGPIEPPPPVGSVPGAVNAQFNVYVVPADDSALSWNDERPETVLNIPPGAPFNFNFTLPEDWTESAVDYTLMTPGLILEAGSLRVTGRSVTYQYSPGRLSDVFPNLEQGGQGEGAYAADLVRLTLFAQGIDASGQRAHLSRTFVIAHDRLYTFR